MRLLVTTVLLLALGAFAVPQTEHDVPATMQRAHEALDNAKRELQSLPAELGEHGRNKAVGHVDDALASLKEAEAWAREHHR